MPLSIHPSIGVARLGNSIEDKFLLNPTKIGGLPYESDDNRQPTNQVTHFKDKSGCILRQGQVFKVFDSNGSEITLNSANVKNIEWTVHLANKKPAWYQFQELNGNLLYGEANSYQNRGIPWRNEGVKDLDERRNKLIIDLGPRTVSGTLQSQEISIPTIPSDYPASYPNPEGGFKQGSSYFKSLGTVMTDNEGRLIVVGGYGFAGGNTDLSGYGGGDEWYDDISDGSINCVVTYQDDTPDDTMQAWIVVGSPDFAPEIVNISTLSDTCFDVGVRHFNLVPDMYSGNEYNADYIANFDRDILPIIERIREYQWVSNVQSMSGFFSFHFDYRDNSDANKPNRMKYYDYFRQIDKKVVGLYDQPQQVLMSSETEGDILPMMPMNSGSNSVNSANLSDFGDFRNASGDPVENLNNVVEKFLALDATQLFLLKQWAEGKFNTDKVIPLVNPIDAASIGNCVGLPMCPGIEVTWSLQNPVIYSDAYQIKHYKNAAYFAANGLSPDRDECEAGDGCEPGDLTKRMACPWQADFFNCTLQVVNFSEPKVNKAERTEEVGSNTTATWSNLPDGVGYVGSQSASSTTKNVDKKVPLTPAYYSYWWPPQSPWDVLTGELDAEGQFLSNLPAGQQTNFARGINSYSQMVEHWSALAFIRDRNSNPENKGFPFFTETERNHELFDFKEVGVGQITGNSVDNETSIPVFFINDSKESLESKGTLKGIKMATYLEQRAFRKVYSRNVLPRSGTRMRG